MKRTKWPVVIGQYVKVTSGQYKRILRRLNHPGTFHTAEGTFGFTIKIINEKIRKVMQKVLDMDDKRLRRYWICVMNKRLRNG